MPRHTYENILETGVYTINHIHQGIIEDAHHTSAKYPENISEFDVTQLEPVYRGDCDAPFVKNCRIQMAMEYLESNHIKANNTVLVVGRIKSLYVDEPILMNDGFIDLSKAQTAAINGLDAYAVATSNQRLTYQRPHKTLKG